MAAIVYFLFAFLKVGIRYWHSLAPSVLATATLFMTLVVSVRYFALKRYSHFIVFNEPWRLETGDTAWARPWLWCGAGQMTPDDPTNLYLTFYWLPFVIILQIEILSWALNGRHRDNPDLVLGSSFIYSNETCDTRVPFHLDSLCLLVIWKVWHKPNKTERWENQIQNQNLLDKDIISKLVARCKLPNISQNRGWKIKKYFEKESNPIWRNGENKIFKIWNFCHDSL